MNRFPPPKWRIQFRGPRAEDLDLYSAASPDEKESSRKGVDAARRTNDPAWIASLCGVGFSALALLLMTGSLAFALDTGMTLSRDEVRQTLWNLLLLLKALFGFIVLCMALLWSSSWRRRSADAWRDAYEIIDRRARDRYREAFAAELLCLLHEIELASTRAAAADASRPPRRSRRFGGRRGGP